MLRKASNCWARAATLAAVLAGCTALIGCGSGGSSAGGQNYLATFTSGLSYNGLAGSFQGAPTNFGSVGVLNVSGEVSTGGVTRDLTVQITDPSIAAGNTYNLGSPPAGVGSNVQYEERAGNLSSPTSDKSWVANGGTLTVVSVNGANITFSVSNATMVPGGTLFTTGASNQAAGTFTLNITPTS